jgi:hypothetical protein
MASKKRATYVATVTGIRAEAIGELYTFAEAAGATVETVTHEVSETTNGVTRASPLTRYPDKVLLLPGLRQFSPKGKRALLVHQHLIQVVEKRDGAPIPRNELNEYLDKRGLTASSYSPAISIMIREQSIRVVEPKTGDKAKA